MRERREDAPGTPSGVPFIDWPLFARRYLPLPPTEHVSLIGRTGSGKTTLAANAIVPGYPYSVALITKRRDTSLFPALKRQGFQIESDPRRLDARKRPHVIYHAPRAAGEATKDKYLAQRSRILALIEAIWDESRPSGGWALYLDEIRYLANRLQLKGDLEELWLEGRGAGITVIAGTQNPVSVPREVFDQADHLFLWRQPEIDRVRRLAEFGGTRREEIFELVPRLADHEALYYRAVDDVLVRTLWRR